MIEQKELDASRLPSQEWQALAPLQEHKEKLGAFIWDLPIEDFRAVKYTAPPLPADAPIPDKDLAITERKIDVSDGHQIILRIYQSLHTQRGSLLFFNAHGGGWVLGNTQTEEAQNRFIAVKNHAVVVSVDYRRAPEFPYPYALNDCFDAFMWCKNHAEDIGIDKERIIVGGGSAGANLIAALALKCRNEGIGGIIGQVLNIPVTCHPRHFPKSRFRNTSFEENKSAPIVSATRMEWFWDKYAPVPQEDSYLSPLLAESLEGLPPTLIQIAGMDPLRDEGLAYAIGLKEANVDTTLKLYAGVPHAFYSYPELPQSKEYLQTMVDWISGIRKI